MGIERENMSTYVKNTEKESDTSKSAEIESKDLDTDKNDTEKTAGVLYRHVKELAQFKLDVEMRREDSLIQQSSHMQTAFSFMTAALFMALPVVIDNRGNLSLNFIFIGVSAVVGLLLVSLVFASLAQRRFKKKAPQNVSELEKFVNDNWENIQTESQQSKQFVGLIAEVQESMAKANNERVKCVRISMGCFLASIIVIAVFYFISLPVIL